MELETAKKRERTTLILNITLSANGVNSFWPPHYFFQHFPVQAFDHGSSFSADFPAVAFFNFARILLSPRCQQSLHMAIRRLLEVRTKVASLPHLQYSGASVISGLFDHCSEDFPCLACFKSANNLLVPRVQQSLHRVTRRLPEVMATAAFLPHLQYSGAGYISLLQDRSTSQAWMMAKHRRLPMHLNPLWMRGR